MAKVHRFGNKVAIYIRRKTTYLSPENADKLGKALVQASESCKTETFAQSTFTTIQVEEK